MDGQIEMKIVDSNIIKLGFLKCQDCEDEPICPHSEHRKGCKTKEILKEIRV